MMWSLSIALLVGAASSLSLNGPRPLPHSGPIYGAELPDTFDRQVERVRLDGEDDSFDESYNDPYAMASDDNSADDNSAWAQGSYEEEEPVRSNPSTKVLKDSVIFNGIKPGFGAHPVPALAANPAIAVQPLARFAPRPVIQRPVFPAFRPAFVGCPPTPPRPFDSKTCTWVPKKDRRHCVRQWECDPVSKYDRVKCPRAPIRPDVGDRCNWIPVLDKKNCIRKYECEPIPEEPCAPAPLPPDDHDHCKWISIKDAQGCILDYECAPVNNAYRSYFRW